MQRRGLVVEPDRRQRGLLWIADVDGGLPPPAPARSKVWFEFTPMARTLRVVAVVPGMFVSRRLCRSTSEKDSANQHQRENVSVNPHSHPRQICFPFESNLLAV